MEKHSVLEKDFLKEKEQDALSFQARYRELQVSSKRTLVSRHARWVCHKAQRVVPCFSLGWTGSILLRCHDFLWCWRQITDSTLKCTSLRKVLADRDLEKLGNGVCLLGQCFQTLGQLDWETAVISVPAAYSLILFQGCPGLGALYRIGWGDPSRISCRVGWAAHAFLYLAA